MNERAQARLARYAELLLEATRNVNVTGARTPDAIAEQIADALTLVPFVRGSLVDVGTGGGLPGIPVAIVREIPVTLIEATAKKVAFLQAALEVLELDGTAVAGRAETLAHDPAYRERFEHATARAVGSMPTVLELTLPFVRVGGSAFLQRGAVSPEERNAAADAALVLGGEVTEEIPTDGERRIVVVRKHEPSPGRFPRRTGVPHKRPLCT